jgi:hypothetical protein
MSTNDRRPEDEPVAWFFEMQRALQAGDLETAAAARRELERLGVDVRFRGGLTPSRPDREGRAS